MASFWKPVARMPFHGCPAAASASKASLKRSGGLDTSVSHTSSVVCQRIKQSRRRSLRAELASTGRRCNLEDTMQLSRALRTASRGTRFARPMSSAAAKADGSEAFVGMKQRRTRVPSKRLIMRRASWNRRHIVTKSGRRESAGAHGADATWKDAIDDDCSTASTRRRKLTTTVRRQRPQQTPRRDRPRAPLDHRGREGPPARHARVDRVRELHVGLRF